jgi:hypothetical protein
LPVAGSTLSLVVRVLIDTDDSCLSLMMNGLPEPQSVRTVELGLDAIMPP